MLSYNQQLDTLHRSGIRIYTNLAAQTPGCINLTIGEPHFETPAPIKAAAIEALQKGQTHYAPNQGILALRQQIAAYETCRGYVCNEENILITAGATGAIFTAMLGVLNPGDSVIIPTPAFPLYESIAKVAGADIAYLDTAKSGFQIEEAALRALVNDRTKLIILNSPNNPTGVALNVASLEAVKRIALEKELFILWDGVYQQLSDGVADLSVDPDLRDRILLCQSFSKPYAMTGWRIGYLAAPKKLLSRLLLLHAAQVAAIPTFIQSACVAALETDVTPMAEHYAKLRQLAYNRLTEMGLVCPKPDGAFYLFPALPAGETDGEDFCTRLIKDGGVATVPGSCFGAPGHFRISCACDEAVLTEGLKRLQNYIRK